MNVPSANQCFYCFSADKLLFVVKIIISVSSWSRKSSLRSVFLKSSDKPLTDVVDGVWRCLRMVCMIISGRGSSPAALSGKVRNAQWRIVLVSSSDVAARALIWLTSSITGMRSGFGAWLCSVGWDRKVSIDKFVWHRAKESID